MVGILHEISKESIKPSSPTPPHLRNYLFSSIDQYHPNIYSPLVLFFPNANTSNTILKTSLSQLLVHYYPLAGRISEDSLSIDCNDQGVDFFEVDHLESTSLSIFLENANEHAINKLFPVTRKQTTLDNLLFVQVTSFSCGGKAIALIMSHKFGDAVSLSCLFTDWAKVAKEGNLLVTPDLISPSILFPPNKPGVKLRNVVMDDSDTVTKRFVFDASNIANLKAKISLEMSIEEAVTAQLYKSVVRASYEAKGNSDDSSNSESELLSVDSDSSKPESESLSDFGILHIVNLRKHMRPPLADNTIGNILSFVTLLCNGNNAPKCLEDTRVCFTKLYDRCAQVTEPVKLFLGAIMERRTICDSNKDTTIIKFGNWCGQGFYQVDFGWGKPIWVGFSMAGQVKNTIYTIETKEQDGVEAWVTMEEGLMAILEKDQELLSFASLRG